MATPPLNLRSKSPPGSPSASDFSYETSPYLYLFTSLTAGSSHIITATSRLETILKANRVTFKAVDCATDEKARRIWIRRAGKRKLPGLVKEGVILADLELVEEWNEFGEIKDNLGGGSVGVPQPHAQTQSTATAAPGVTAAKSAVPTLQDAPIAETTATGPTLQQQQQALLAREAAAFGAQRSKPKPIPSAKASSSTTAVATETDALSSSAEGTPRLHPRSPELDQDHDLDSLKHNTSSSTALPPLAIRTLTTSPPAPASILATAASDSDRDPASSRARADTASSLTSPDLPSAPPPTAIERSTTFADAIAENEEKAMEGAAPARKSGLEAVTSDSAITAATLAGASSSQLRTRRESPVSPAIAEQIKEIEQQTLIQEAKGEEETDVDAGHTGDLHIDTDTANVAEEDDESEIAQTPHSPTISDTGEDPAEPAPDVASPRILEGGNHDKHIKFQEPTLEPDAEPELELEKVPELDLETGEEEDLHVEQEPDSDPPSPRITRGNHDKHITFQGDAIKEDPRAAEKAGESVGD